MLVNKNPSKMDISLQTKFLVLEYLNSLKADAIYSDKADAIDTVVGLLEGEFPDAKQDAENFKNYSYYPVSLDDIVNAGIERLELVAYSESVDSVITSPKFVAFLDVVVKKGFFEGTEEGSLEYLQRHAKLIQKFREKMRTSEPSAVDVEKEAEEFKTLGNKAINAKDFEEAEAMYSKALDLSSDGPNSHIYYSNRAAAFSYQEKYQDAIEDCLLSLALSPDYVKAYSRLGWLYFKTKKYDEAIAAYERSVELEPSNEANKASLASAKEKLKKGSKLAKSTGLDAPAGGMPDMAGMMNNPAGMMNNPMMKSALDKVGGQAGLAGLMNNPQMMQMAQQMMKDPAMMEQAMSMLGGGGGGGGGMPDMNALASMMGGMGDTGGGAPSSAPSSSSVKKPFTGFED